MQDYGKGLRMKEFLQVLEITSYIFLTVIVSTILGAYVLTIQGQGSINGFIAFTFGLCLLLSFIGFIFLCYRIFIKIFKKEK